MREASAAPAGGRTAPCPGACGTRAATPPRSGDPPVLALQRTVGNRAFRRLLMHPATPASVDGLLPRPFGEEEDAGAEPRVPVRPGLPLPYREAVEAADRARFARNSAIVRVQAQIPAETVDHTRTGREIAMLAQAESGRRSSADNAGLTRARLGMRMAPTTIAGTAAGGRTPFWLTDLEVTPLYRFITVFIARGYAPSSCEYGVTLAHENEHVQADRELLERYAGRMRAALVFADLPTAQNPLSVASPAEGEQAVETLLRGILTPVYDELRLRLREANGALDTPASYRQVHARCSNW